MHWQIHKDSTAHHAVAERRGERLPVAIAIGCDPVVTLRGHARRCPRDIDEYLFAGFLRGERVEMVDCLTVPLQVPAHAQIVLEGYIEPGERLPEGPFGDHTGFYTPVEPFPVLHVECMTMQRDPIYHSIVTSKPPQEDRGLGKATERIFLPLLKLLIPDIVDYDMPAAGRLPQLPDRLDPQALPEARAEGDERDLGRAPAVADQADRGGGRGLRRARLPEVAFRAFGNVDYARDLLLTEGPVDHLDHASYQQFWGGKAGRRRDPQAADRGLHPGLAGGDGDVPGGRGAGGQALEGVRHLSEHRGGAGRRGGVRGTAVRADPPPARFPGEGVPAAGGDRALGLRAAVRVPVRADRDDGARRRRALGRPRC